MKNYLEYKGYIGTIDVSVEDRVFYGTIHGINDLVTFESVDFEGLEREFKSAVDDYLIICEECGKEAEKSYKGQFNVRVSSELHRKIAMNAIKENVSLNQYVEKALTFYTSESQLEIYKASEKLNAYIEKLNTTISKRTWNYTVNSFLQERVKEDQRLCTN